MINLTMTSFKSYFRELHGTDPYPWQCRLANAAMQGHWPAAINLPTGSGKTACLDIALFALAYQADFPADERNAPRRIFFCVNRRVIVDEAYHRVRRIARKIWEAERLRDPDSVLATVARRLRSVANTESSFNTPPIDVLEVRGGIYRDNRWSRSVNQPTVICTTLDQLGSRLLFSGYGVSDGAAPVQASLIAYDSLILLDEAHISEPFRQTLDSVQQYLNPALWSERSVGAKPFVFVPMTATPNDAMKSKGVVELDDDDRRVVQLKQRLSASKVTELKEVKSIVQAASDAAKQFAKDSPTAIGIIVNRVATARAIHSQLCQWRAETNEKRRSIPEDSVIELVIGSMRPLDRDNQSIRLRPLVGPGRPSPESNRTSFVVATQCLEVGADCDFDVLITECASLDALRQRFGRLNRGGREIQSAGLVLIQTKDVKVEAKLDDEKPHDPIYGNSLSRTWNWLSSVATNGTVNFGIDAFSDVLTQHFESGQPPVTLLSPTASLNAPVLLPAYLDLWCQTSPRPSLAPDVALFIHGPNAGQPDVQVCWRADLVEDEHTTRDDWANIVALLPPTAAECIRIPISRFKNWLQGNPLSDAVDTGDALAVIADGDANTIKDNQSTANTTPDRLALVWRGVNEATRIVTSPKQVMPGDTFIIPSHIRSSLELTHIPQSEANMDGQIPDLAEVSFALSRDRAALRLHPSLLDSLPDDCRRLLDAALSDDPPRRSGWSAGLREAAKSLDNADQHLFEVLSHLASHPFGIEPYPDARGVVLTSSKPLGGDRRWYLPPIDDGDNDASQQSSVTLYDHARHVVSVLEKTLDRLPLDSFRSILIAAGKCHDLGKADERFQAMLRRTDRTDAWMIGTAPATLLAKSPGVPQTQAQAIEARSRAGLPSGFRHEMLSVQLVSHFAQQLGMPQETLDTELVLYLIGSHHGHGRPFAPIVFDEELPEVPLADPEHRELVTHQQRCHWIATHRIDSGIAERFWQFTRRFGWWGVAYLEAILRLADQQASAAETLGSNESTNDPQLTRATS